MPRDDVQEIAESNPEETFQVAELGVRFVVKVKSLLPGEGERVDVGRLGHDVAELAPQGLALRGREREAVPGRICEYVRNVTTGY